MKHYLVLLAAVVCVLAAAFVLPAHRSSPAESGTEIAQLTVPSELEDIIRAPGSPGVTGDIDQMLQGAVAPRAGPPAGRYVLVLSPLSSGDSFLVDTQTGRVWRMREVGDTTSFTRCDVEGLPES